ncbi:MAG: SusD/RagB family nutrient-binding outer membrane lipoprotein [Balneolaceae bacterium]|nr:SusD/RagB family nutrient-binding outer membrane lipoprotein [Balneolaceae bacterium]
MGTNNLKYILLFCFLFNLQCDLISTNENHNELGVIELPDPSFLLNSIQLEVKTLFSNTSKVSGELSRMNFMIGDTYSEAISPSSLNRIYGDAYNDIFKDFENLEKISIEKGLYVHLGIAKILKAYTMILLVDIFGDIPYENAIDPTNFNPALDDDEIIYQKALDLLNQAANDLHNENNKGFPELDLFYAGTQQNIIDSWIRTANTIKLKAHLNMRNKNEVNALIQEEKLITENIYDFQFQYSSNSDFPNSRHPMYEFNYRDNEPAFTSMSNSYLYMMLSDKDSVDPRMNYYFFREALLDSSLDVNEWPCRDYSAPSHFDEDDPFCILPDGYFGENHLSVPVLHHLPITTYGVYPIGGSFDEGEGGRLDNGDGLNGEGIEPILLSSFTHFMIAEAELSLNNDISAARAALELAIHHSFAKVQSFGEILAEGSDFEITASKLSEYKNVVLSRFDNANSIDDKMRVIAKEYYFALFGNGYEAYNLMRRTGYPDRMDNLQPALSPDPGNWFRSLIYPHNMVHRNESIDQKTDQDVLNGPFWDPNPGSTKFNF